MDITQITNLGQLKKSTYKSRTVKEEIRENLIKKLQNNLPYVSVIHIADVPGRHEPGTGEINFANIYRKLVELKFEGTIAMEFRPTGDPVAMLRAARAMAIAAGTAS